MSAFLPLEVQLAQQAKQLGLSSLLLGQADPAAVQQFCRLVLDELTARGLIEDAVEWRCYAARQSN